MTATKTAGLLAACVEAPDDADLRLVTADAFEDAGMLWQASRLRSLVRAWSLGGRLAPRDDVAPTFEDGKAMAAKLHALASSLAPPWAPANLWGVWGCLLLRCRPHDLYPVLARGVARLELSALALPVADGPDPDVWGCAVEELSTEAKALHALKKEGPFACAAVLRRVAGRFPAGKLAAERHRRLLAAVLGGFTPATRTEEDA